MCRILPSIFARLVLRNGFWTENLVLLYFVTLLYEGEQMILKVFGQQDTGAVRRSEWDNLGTLYLRDRVL